MKKVQKIVLLLGIIVSTIVPNQGHLTPQNTIIVFDLDAVLLTKPWWLKAQIIFDGIRLINPFTIASYFNALLAMKYLYMENSEGTKEILYDAHGNSLNGLTFHLLAYSIQDTRLAPYAASILQRIEASTCFIEGTRAIAQELKNKGFTIAFATNKDRVSYDIDAQALGNDLTGLADKVFVAQPGNSNAVMNAITQFAQRTDTPASYRALAEEAINIQPTKTILHAPGKKPELQYYQYVTKALGQEKNIIFIDDKKENIDGFNALQASTRAKRIGIWFKNPQQFACECIDLGILSEIDDHKLLQKLDFPLITPSHGTLCNPQ